MHRKLGWLFSFPLALACTHAMGADVDFSENFHDRYEMSLLSGAMFSPIGADNNRPTENYTLSGLQFAWMLTDVRGPGWLRGNWELPLEAMGGKVFDGKGSYVVG